ncbi:MAG: 50S ribosomal protein L17 [Solitalea-like symbiont of Tyrophagus putrescentiae]
MRHNKKINHLGRTKAHRVALLQNLSVSLIEFKRICTTLAKAKALRTYIEPVLTKGKTDTVSSRREVFRQLQHKSATKLLFGDIAVKIADRPGGYTRIIRTNKRKGDSAEMAFIELVDYNNIYKSTQSTPTDNQSRKTRRGRSAVKKNTELDNSTEVATEGKNSD